ncbi:hypothetical protein HGRIS_000965 [Hohenbuehelia grisea]|uniref:Uncharacterized protein n=1 Tax=Hohenbuehelia grisea TaxID=104357 RepID=A0ABR3IQF5_9AGAR
MNENNILFTFCHIEYAIMSTPNERDPLLPETSAQRAGERPFADTLDPQGEVRGTTETNEFNLKLAWSIFVDAVPVILSYALQNSLQTTTVLVAGHLGPEELSISAFSTMLAFVTGWCVALGGTTALDTLGSQAFTGGQRTDLSIHLQRCIALLLALFVPVGILWYHIEPVLLALGQSASLSYGVQRFLRVLILGAPGYIGFESLKKYLQCQGIMSASTIVLCIVAPINVVLNVVLIHYTPLGILGSPVALVITYTLCFLLLVAFTVRSPTHQRNGTWGGLEFKTVFKLQGCSAFLKLALPGILMVGTEWAAFEIVALAAGRLGEIPLAAQSVIMTTDQVLNTVFFGIGIAASTRVGNLIGNRSASGAKHAAHASALISVVIGSIIMTSMVASKRVFGRLFSDDQDVIKLVSQIMPLVASFQVADGLAGSCGGVLRGLGRQHLGAFFNIVAYYVIALPMGITLAFHSKTHLGLHGLWIGQVVALFIVGLSEYAVVWVGTDWDKEVADGIRRNQEEAKRRALSSVDSLN